MFIEVQLEFSLLTVNAILAFTDPLMKQLTSVEVIPDSNVNFFMLCFDWMVTL